METTAGRRIPRSAASVTSGADQLRRQGIWPADQRITVPRPPKALCRVLPTTAQSEAPDTLGPPLYMRVEPMARCCTPVKTIDRSWTALHFCRREGDRASGSGALLLSITRCTQRSAPLRWREHRVTRQSRLWSNSTIAHRHADHRHVAQHLRDSTSKGLPLVPLYPSSPLASPEYTSASCSRARDPAT